MKVKELIAVLQTLDPELDVSIDTSDGEYGPDQIKRIDLFDGADVELTNNDYSPPSPGTIWPLPIRDYI